MHPSVEIGPVRLYHGDRNGKYPDGNQVIVQGANLRAVFDSPLVANLIGPHYDGADLVIQGHVHEDHVTGLHRIPHVPIYAHEADLPALQSWEGLAAAYGYDESVFQAMRESIERDFGFQPRPDAMGYQDGAQWDLGGGVVVRAIHAPGHTSGHSILLVEPVGVAFIGDIDLSGFGPYYGDLTSNLGDFRRTLQRLPELDATTWITSHHRGIYSDRQQFLQDLAEIAAKIDLREQRLLEHLEQGPQTLEQLTAKRILYKPDAEGVWIEDAERRTISMHLAELLDAGRVTRDANHRYLLAHGN